MDILFLCGVFAKENETEIIAQSRGGVEFSANEFQKKLIDGLRQTDISTSVLSAPFIGSYPNRSIQVFFRGFVSFQTLCTYVPFCNLWGIRNISRAHSLRLALQDFIRLESSEKLIVVYSAHEPFLQVAAYAKKKDPRIQICLVVPDLPEYMNLSTKRNRIYNFCKRIDTWLIYRYCKQVDSFVVLTEQMKRVLNVGSRPCTVVEGIISHMPTPNLRQEIDDGSVRIVYTGKIDEKFGIKNLVDAFLITQNPQYRLILCGAGDAVGYVREKAALDSRIEYKGQVLPEEAKRYVEQASILVNPRPNNDVYTRYSFPSKNIEYMLSGNPVVAYLLDGMPSIYSDFIFPIHQDGPPEQNIKDSINQAVEADYGQIKEKYLRFLQYAEGHLTALKVAKEILGMYQQSINKSS